MDHCAFLVNYVSIYWGLTLRLWDRLGEGADGVHRREKSRVYKDLPGPMGMGTESKKKVCILPQSMQGGP